MPGPTLWFKTFPAYSYSVQIEHAGLQEGWYSPDNQEYLPWTEPGDTICFRYTFAVPLQEAFIQNGSARAPIVYWLDAPAMPTGPSQTLFGWKTSTLHWNDDAAWTSGEEPYSGPWGELRYPLTHPLEGQSMDLAFGLYGFPVEPEPELDFGDALTGIGKDARLILSRELRHSILKLATEKKPAAAK